MNKLLYKPIGMVTGAAAGLLAGVIFKQVWKLVTHEDHVPEATDENYGWTEVLVAAALHGAIFAIVKAAVDRGSAEGVRRLTAGRIDHDQVHHEPEGSRGQRVRLAT